jgi:hypothetical protein
MEKLQKPSNSEGTAAVQLLWEAGSWGRGQFGNPEEGERSPLETVTKKRLVKRLYVCCSYSDLWSVTEWDCRSYL